MKQKRPVAWLVEWTTRGMVELEKKKVTLEFKKPASFGFWGQVRRADPLYKEES